VNVIVGAHTHGGVAHLVNGIAIVESYAYGRAFSRVDLSVDAATGSVLATNIHPPHDLCRGNGKSLDACHPGEYEGSPVSIDAGVLDAIRPDLEQAKKKQDERLGVTLAGPLTKGHGGSAPLNNWVADLMLQALPGNDVALVNAGGIRADLPAGPLTYGSVYTMFPFDNRFAVATVKAALLRKLLEQSATHGEAYAISGIRAVASCEQGAVRVRLLRSGRPIGDDAPVRLLVSDYLAATSSFAEAGMPKSAFTYPDGPGIRESLVALLRGRGGVVPAEDLARFDPKHPRIAVPNGPPVRCQPAP
jgi:5'-nucleotidase